jgi:hypothetical protein
VQRQYMPTKSPSLLVKNELIENMSLVTFLAHLLA